jgi:hypothetical protein
MEQAFYEAHQEQQQQQLGDGKRVDCVRCLNEYLVNRQLMDIRATVERVDRSASRLEPHAFAGWALVGSILLVALLVPNKRE